MKRAQIEEESVDGMLCSSAWFSDTVKRGYDVRMDGSAGSRIHGWGRGGIHGPHTRRGPPPRPGTHRRRGSGPTAFGGWEIGHRNGGLRPGRDAKEGGWWGVAGGMRVGPRRATDRGGCQRGRGCRWALRMDGRRRNSVGPDRQTRDEGGGFGKELVQVAVHPFVESPTHPSGGAVPHGAFESIRPGGSVQTRDDRVQGCG